MPSDQFGDGGGEIIHWDDENLLLIPSSNHEQWLHTSSTSASASASNLIYYTSTSFENQLPFTDTSGRHHPSGGVPIASDSSNDAFFNPTNQPFEFIQGQHWPDQITQENVTGPVAPVPVSGGGEWTTPLAFTESSPRDSIGSVGEILTKAASERVPRQDFNISRSFLSPSRSVIPQSKTPAEPAKSRRVTKPQQEESRANKPIPNIPMNVESGYSSPTAGQGNFDRKKNSLGLRGAPLNRPSSRSHTDPQNEEDQRRRQFGLTSRGPSRVSSISGHSRKETFSPEVLGDKLSSTASMKPENRAAEKIPGVLRIPKGEAPQNGQHTLPSAKGFSIQIGSESFKLSGASIMSDGQYSLKIRSMLHDLLRILEHPHTSQSFSRTSFNRGTVLLGHCTLIGTP